MSTDKKTPMTPDAAARSQAHADRTGTNQHFEERAQRETGARCRQRARASPNRR